MSTKFFKSHRTRRGLTLLEVVAGLALMATLVVALLLLKARFTHQLVNSEKRLQAVSAADALLTDWWADSAAFPINRSGTVAECPGLAWRTELVPNDAASRLGSKVVRLDIVADARVITSVDLMLPLEVHPAP